MRLWRIFWLCEVSFHASMIQYTMHAVLTFDQHEHAVHTLIIDTGISSQVFGIITMEPLRNVFEFRNLPKLWNDKLEGRW